MVVSFRYAAMVSNFICTHLHLDSFAHGPASRRSRSSHRIDGQEVCERHIFLAQCPQNVLREETAKNGQCWREEVGCVQGQMSSRQLTIYYDGLSSRYRSVIRLLTFGRFEGFGADPQVLTEFVDQP